MPLFIMTGEYLAELKPELLEAHIVWLTAQFEAGTFLVSGGVGAVEGKPPAALAIMEAEPFYNAGAIRHDVAPYSARVLGSDLDARFVTPELIRIVARQ